MKSKNTKYIVGVDEAGRGPLAGPVSVGLVMVPIDFDWNLIPGVNDSKQLSEQKRETIYKRAKVLQKEGQLNFVVKMVSAKLIDKEGIAVCIKKAMAAGLKKLMSENKGAVISLDEVMVKLDGSLYAPTEYVHQETIIKGDSKEKVIGLASIMAKVTRDRYMQKQATQPTFVQYHFAQHKGYGTKLHREMIAKYGLSPEHRASYCKNITML